MSGVLAACLAAVPAQAEPIAVEVVGAQAAFDRQTGRSLITFKMSDASARLFGELTRKNVGRKMEIRVDGRVLSAPIIREAIVGGIGQISDDKLTARSARDLAERIAAGQAKIEFAIAGD